MMHAERIATVIRSTLRDSVSGVQEPVIALSGGVDSCAVLAAMVDVDNPPVVVSYTPSTHESTDFQMARDTAKKCGLTFVPVVVDMSDESLEELVRTVIGTNYHSKVQVESLAPMVAISRIASQHGRTLFTGDQSDGYFCLSKWAAHNHDRKMGVPYRERSRNVKDDTDPARIDAIRKRYYEDDLSCSEGVRSVCALVGMDTRFPFRHPDIRHAFTGTVWRDVNDPRIKEPVRQAFDHRFGEQIGVRPVQVNLHKGDSYFGDRLSASMARAFPGYLTPRGLYSAMWRGEV